MKIIIDCTYDANGIPCGFQYMETDRVPFSVINEKNQDGSDKHQIDTIIYFNEHPELRDAAGFNVVSILPGLPKGTTRWQALCHQINGSSTTDELRALNIKE